MAKDEKPAVPLKKHRLSILDEHGRTKQQSMMELNRDAQGLQLGAKRRRQGIMKQVTDVVSAALKRAG